MQETIEKYKQENEKLKNEQIKLKEIISIQQSQKQNSQDCLNKIDSTFNSRIHTMFSKLFTPTQIDTILNNNKRIYKCTPEDISSAISLRSVSPKVYRYPRETKKFPLPGNDNSMKKKIIIILVQ